MDESKLNGDQFLDIYGIVPASHQLDEVRRLLQEQIRLEQEAQGNSDFEVLRMCAVALFNAAIPSDTPLIWKAKQSSMDASVGLEVQLLCGAGLQATKSYLKDTCAEPCAGDILEYLEHCEQNGDFDGFDVVSFRQELEAYYSE